jgi:hypothetical protein
MPHQADMGGKYVGSMSLPLKARLLKVLDCLGGTNGLPLAHLTIGTHIFCGITINTKF